MSIKYLEQQELNLFESNNFVITKKVKLKYGEYLLKEMTLNFKEVSKEVAKKTMLKNHYSKKWNNNFGKINIGVFYKNKLYGVATFGNMKVPKSYKNINDSLNQNNVLELNRLWVDDFLGGNVETAFLSACWKIIRKFYKDVKVIQSFADGRLGCGTIYKASSFKYFGFHKTLFLKHKETKETYNATILTNTARPSGMINLCSLIAQKKIIFFYVKTYRYIFLIDKNVKVNYKEEDFPKYEKGIEIKKFDDNRFEKEIIRAFILSFILNKKDDYKILKQKINNKNIYLFLEQSKNKTITKIVNDKNIKKDFDEFVIKIKKTFERGD